MTTTYQKRISSPYQPKSNIVVVKKHPAQDEIAKCLGSYNLNVTFTEDKTTIEIFKHIPNIIAILCTIKKDDKIIGVGRGHASLSKVNKYVERTVFTAVNYSLIDAISKTTRIVDALHTDTEANSKSVPVSNDARYESKKFNQEMITDKQRNFLVELIHTNITDEDDRESRIMQLDDLTRQEASEAIQSFQN